MTIKSSGSLSMSEIDAEFALGKSLSSYRGVTWYTDDYTSGTFPNTGISMYDFYNKRKTSAGSAILATYTGASAVYSVGTDNVIEWTGDGSVSFSGSVTVRILVVGGGGPGGLAGNDRSAGGGGGGASDSWYTVSGYHNITIGTGGVAAYDGTDGDGNYYRVAGTPGGTTTVANIVSAAGGQVGADGRGNYGWGATGGSSGNGYVGGDDGGGGGGAGGRAQNANGSGSAPGGTGLWSDITGAASYYGGGGAGGASPSAGGAGGGGASHDYRQTADSGTNGLGGGGAGRLGYGVGGNGGSGRVIIRGYFRV